MTHCTHTEKERDLPHMPTTRPNISNERKKRWLLFPLSLPSDAADRPPTRGGGRAKIARCCCLFSLRLFGLDIVRAQPVDPSAPRQRKNTVNTQNTNKNFRYCGKQMVTACRVHVADASRRGVAGVVSHQDALYISASPTGTLMPRTEQATLLSPAVYNSSF